MRGVSNKHCLLTFFIILANSADPDEMPPYVAFHLGFQCFPKYLCTGIFNKRVNLKLFIVFTLNFLYAG